MADTQVVFDVKTYNALPEVFEADRRIRLAALNKAPGRQVADQPR
jgi:hypothetical protein